MATTYQSAVRSPSRPSLSSQSPRSSQSSSSPSPIQWSRNNNSSLRRLSDSRMRTSQSQSWRTMPRRAWAGYMSWSETIMAAFWKMSPLYRALTVGMVTVSWVFIILMLLYSDRFFAWLRPISEAWRERPGGWIVIFLLIFVTAFPPVIGYSTANTIAGFIYGFPLGWPIAAAACTAGSLCSFIASRTILSGYVDRMVGNDHRFVALGQVLRREGLMYLTAIRFCPLPFSLSNGFLATIPSITPLAFTISTALSSPKLLVHIFIGSRLALLGDKMTARDKAVNYLSMAIGGGIGITVGYVIYRRTMARAAQLAEEEELGAAEEGESRYEDTQTTLMDPEDAAAIMSDDDVSLWDTQGDDSWGDGYDDEVDDGKKNGKSQNGNRGSHDSSRQ